MTVKKKRELFLGPLLTSRGSLALPHQKTFDRRHFSPFREEKPLSASPSTPKARDDQGCPQPSHAQGTPEERERLAASMQKITFLILVLVQEY